MLRSTVSSCTNPLSLKFRLINISTVVSIVEWFDEIVPLDVSLIMPKVTVHKSAETWTKRNFRTVSAYYILIDYDFK
jgi:hypothetical protein